MQRSRGGHSHFNDAMGNDEGAANLFTTQQLVTHGSTTKGPVNQRNTTRKFKVWDSASEPTKKMLLAGKVRPSFASLSKILRIQGENSQRKKNEKGGTYLP
jgi:hypothetical protein